MPTVMVEVISYTSPAVSLELLWERSEIKIAVFSFAFAVLIWAMRLFENNFVIT